MTGLILQRGFTWTQVWLTMAVALGLALGTQTSVARNASGRRRASGGAPHRARPASA